MLYCASSFAVGAQQGVTRFSSRLSLAKRYPLTIAFSAFTDASIKVNAP